MTEIRITVDLPELGPERIPAPTMTEGTSAHSPQRRREAPEPPRCPPMRERRLIMADPAALPWRTGRRVGRTIYSQADSEASDEDTLIGVMDTAELAAEAVAGHNARLAMSSLPITIMCATCSGGRTTGQPHECGTA